MPEGCRTQVMGILNVTPDSFFEGSRVNGEEALLKRVQDMLKDGAAMIDVGACSTRPGSQFADSEMEAERLLWSMPVIKSHFPEVPLSVDTFRPEIARLCLENWGRVVVNDISGGTDEMFEMLASYQAPYILTYNHTPEADALDDMKAFFDNKLSELGRYGVKEIILDPGFGFAKTLDQNYRIMAHLEAVQAYGLPVLVGISRKSMIFRLLDSTPAQSLNGTTVLNTISALAGVEWLRVHDVKEAVETVRIVHRMNLNY